MQAQDPSAPALCVLASGSSGNASVLRTSEGQLVLIDAGISPRRTEAALAALGHTLHDIRAVVLTHLDSDHFYTAWTSAITRRLPSDAHVWVSTAHANARRLQPLAHASRLRTFDTTPFQPAANLTFSSRLAKHDDQGVATFRIQTPTGTLGYLTDLGEVTQALTDYHTNVDVLAIESNYCPTLQARSERPDFLKRRIMGGAGHLSNHQCLAAAEAIAPTAHAVFLHLSRDCNHPDLVAALHEGADYARTIAAPNEPTRWVSITPATPPAPQPHRPHAAIHTQNTLFGANA